MQIKLDMKEVGQATGAVVLIGAGTVVFLYGSAFTLVWSLATLGVWSFGAEDLANNSVLAVAGLEWLVCLIFGVSNLVTKKKLL